MPSRINQEIILMYQNRKILGMKLPRNVSIHRYQDIGWIRIVHFVKETPHNRT